LKRLKKKERFVMPEKSSHLFTNFIVRAIVGMALIFFINEFLGNQGIDVRVGMNLWTVLTSGILGTPGVALLYGISFYGIM
jgi:pro-sigmaK processing inhibitor BofA